jgi:ribosomal protein S18 acetylase RimI-like enzyme
VDLLFTHPGEPLYQEELELRFRVLREPLGQSRDTVQFPFEKDSLHLVAREGAAVVGCVLFHPEAGERGRLFQMAVEARLQGQGVGAALVRRLEQELRTRGIREVTLHARQTAVAFYERLGYSVEGDPFVEVGLPHRHMRRVLGATDR